MAWASRSLRTICSGVCRLRGRDVESPLSVLQRLFDSHDAWTSFQGAGHHTPVKHHTTQAHFPATARPLEYWKLPGKALQSDQVLCGQRNDRCDLRREKVRTCLIASRLANGMLAWRETTGRSAAGAQCSNVDTEINKTFPLPSPHCERRLGGEGIEDLTEVLRHPPRKNGKRQWSNAHIVARMYRAATKLVPIAVHKTRNTGRQ